MNEAKREPSCQGSGMNGRLAEAAYLQVIEGNALSLEEVAMFEMFEREAWSPDARRSYVARKFKDRRRIAAAE